MGNESLCRTAGIAGNVQIHGILPLNSSSWKIFLNCNRNCQIFIPTNIGNAKSALTKDPAHNILVLQDCSHGELVRLILSSVIKSAVLAHRCLGFGLHTSITIHLFHFHPSGKLYVQ